MTVTSAEIAQISSFCNSEIYRIKEKSIHMLRAAGAIIGIAMAIFGCFLDNGKLFLGGLLTWAGTFFAAEEVAPYFHFLTNIPLYEKALAYLRDSNFTSFAKRSEIFGETTILMAVGVYQNEAIFRAKNQCHAQ